jgi:phage terminase small subunit
MTILKNARHELFAQKIAQGMTATAAYAAAGYRKHDGNAATLRGNQRICARIDEILSEAAAHVEVTVKSIVFQLDEDREFARLHRQPSAAIAATMGKAKVVGLLNPRSVPDANDMNISNLTDEELEQYERIVVKMGEK